MAERLSTQAITELIEKATTSSYSSNDRPRDEARQKLRTALTEAYREADEAAVLREQLDALVREKLRLEQERRELIAQAEIGGDLVVYAPMFFGPRDEIDLTQIPRGHAIVLTDDPVLGPKVRTKKPID